MGREPVLGGLLAGLAGCQHIGDQSSFGGCDLVNGAVDGETFEKIVRRHAACGGDDAVETEIGLGGEEGVAVSPMARLVRSATVTISGAETRASRSASSPASSAGTPPSLRSCRRLLRPACRSCGRLFPSPAAISRMLGPKREITASRLAPKSTLRTHQTMRECSRS